jgi:hypothetical protein
LIKGKIRKPQKSVKFPQTQLQKKVLVFRDFSKKREIRRRKEEKSKNKLDKLALHMVIRWLLRRVKEGVPSIGNVIRCLR